MYLESSPWKSWATEVGLGGGNLDQSPVGMVSPTSKLADHRFTIQERRDRQSFIYKQYLASANIVSHLKGEGTVPFLEAVTSSRAKFSLSDAALVLPFSSRLESLRVKVVGQRTLIKKAAEETEAAWSDEPSEVVHLTDDSFGN